MYILTSLHLNLVLTYTILKSHFTCSLIIADPLLIYSPKKGLKSRPLLINFLQDLLDDPKYIRYISWRDPQQKIFRIENPPGVAYLWGVAKGVPNMDYAKLSRSLRNYYKLNLMKKANIEGLRHCYQYVH